MLRTMPSKDQSLLKDTEWDVSVKKKPSMWKTWVRCSIIFFLMLIVLAVVLLVMCGYVYRHDFLGFIQLKPFTTEPTSHAFSDERIHAGTVRMVARWLNHANQNENTVWSPLTVILGLSLLLEGTTGQTAYEIKSTMGWIGIDKSYVRSYLSRVITRLNELQQLDIIVANRMFLHNSYDVTSAYKNILNQHYKVSIDHLDFTNANALQSINKWGLQESRGQIKELIPLDVINPTTKMVLSTLLTFKGEWKLPFSPNRTKKAEFTSVSGKKRQVDMMYQTGKFTYGEFPAHGFSALELPYSEPNITMVVLLPRSLSLLKAMLKEQDGTILINLSSKMTRTDVEVCIPKFTIEKGTTIENQLSSLGIRRLFDPSSANLELMSPNSELYVQKITHRVKIEVFESGTSGQASSSSILEGRSLTSSFCADQPFIFYVEDKETNSVVFWGEYNGPED